jgi:WD40 repeat protein
VHRLWSVAFLFATLALHSSQDKPGPTTRRITVKTRLLFPHPTDKIIAETLRTSDTGKVAFVVKTKDGKERVMLNGKAQEPFANIVPPDLLAAAQRLSEQDRAQLPASEGSVSRLLRFSPDNEHVYYTAFTGKGYVIASDKGKTQVYTSIMDGMPVFSRNSKNIAFAAGKNGRYAVVLNDKELGTFDDLLVGSLLFSPNSERLAYAAFKSGEWRVFVDGESYKAMEGIGEILFSPDSRRIAYAAFTRNNKSAVMVDGQMVGEHEAIGERSLSFSPDSKQLVFAAFDKGAWNIHLFTSEGVQTFGPYQAIGENEGRPQYSKDGKRLVWTAQIGSLWYVFENGKELSLPPVGKAKKGEPVTGIGILKGTPRFSNDGKRLAVGFKQEKGWMVWCEGEQSEHFESLVNDSLRFSRDSKRLAFVGIRQKMFVPVLNFKEGPPCAEVSPTRISGGDTSGTIAFAVKRFRTVEEVHEARKKDPNSLAYYWMILANGEPLYGPFHEAMPEALGVSWDGNRFCIPAKTKEGWAMWVNGERRMEGLPMWYRFEPETHLLEMIRVTNAGYELLQEAYE